MFSVLLSLYIPYIYINICCILLFQCRLRGKWKVVALYDATIVTLQQSNSLLWHSTRAKAKRHSHLVLIFVKRELRVICVECALHSRIMVKEIIGDGTIGHDDVRVDIAENNDANI